MPMAARGCGESRRRRPAWNPTGSPCGKSVAIAGQSEEHGSVSEIRWKGNWWLPEALADMKPGTLHYGDDGRLRLELIGGFSSEVRSPIANGFTVSLRDPNFPVIHGICGSERFTLLETHAAHSSGGFFSDISDQTLSALRGLRGIHVSSAHETVFDSAEVQLEYLLGWARQTTMQAAITISEGRWTGEQTAHSKRAEDLTATHGDMTLTLKVPHTQFRVAGRPAGQSAHADEQRVGSARTGKPGARVARWLQPHHQSNGGPDDALRAHPFGCVEANALVHRVGGTPDTRRSAERGGGHGPPGPPPCASNRCARIGGVPVHPR